MGWLASLAALATPILGRVLLALNFSLVTFLGGSIAFHAVKDQIVAQLGQGPTAALQLVGLGGGWVALGMILGAMNFAVTFWLLSRSTRLVGGSAAN